MRKNSNQEIQRGIVLVALVLFALVLFLLQLWLFGIGLDQKLGGFTDAVIPGAVVSAAIFFVNLWMLRGAVKVDRDND